MTQANSFIGVEIARKGGKHQIVLKVPLREIGLWTGTKLFESLGASDSDSRIDVASGFGTFQFTIPDKFSIRYVMNVARRLHDGLRKIGVESILTDPVSVI